jgi:pilus assembly protein CpaE
MIDILLLTSDDGHAGRIAGLLAKSGVGHRLHTCQGNAPDLKQYAASIATSDLLIVDDDALGSADLALIEETLAATPRLSCMIVTPSLSKDLLMAAMRAGVRHVLPWPLDEQEFTEEIKHVASKRVSSARREGRVVSLVSCRGGSGATFIAANLAYTLAATRDKRVLLIDLNRQFANASLLITDKPAAATLADLCAQIDRLDAAFFEGCVTSAHPNLDVLAGAGDPIKAAELRPAQLERLLDLVRPLYDAVIIDVGQTLDPVSILALDQSYAIGAVLKQDIPHLQAGRRLFDILLELGYAKGKVQLLVNQYEKNAPIRLSTLEETLGMPASVLLARDDKHAAEAVNHGAPLAMNAKASPLAQSFHALADLTWPRPQPPSKSAWRRLFAPKPAPVRQLKTEP